MTQEKAHDLFYKILRLRIVEEEIAKKYSEQQMRCPVHLSIGQEATPVGVSESLNADDIMVGTHRAHAAYLAKGGSLDALIAELYGRVTGCSRGQGGSMHLIDLKHGFLCATSIVGGTVPVGVGAAFAFKLKKEPRISVISIGDTVLEEGVFHESANFASLKKLPVIFMCENNNFSCYSPLSNRQPQRPLTDVAIAHGMTNYKMNGNDVCSIYENMQKIIQDIRSGSGPVFIEFSTYRYLEHCGPNNDDHLKYRDAAEVQFWIENDAITLCKNYLKKNNFWQEDLETKFRQKIHAEVNESFKKAIAAPYPEQSELGAYIYAE